MSKIDNSSTEQRPQDAVRDAGSAVADFVRDHPLLVVAGGIALGAVAASFLPRGTGRRIARRAISLAEVAGTAGALLGTRAKETAQATGAGLREQGGVVADRLEKLGSAASARAEKWIDPVEAAATKAATKVVKKASELRSRVRH